MVPPKPQIRVCQTILSRSFEETQRSLSRLEICSEYFLTFSGSKEQILRSERYSNPKITIEIAGPLVLETFTKEPYFLPEDVMNSIRAWAVE